MADIRYKLDAYKTPFYVGKLIAEERRWSKSVTFDMKFNVRLHILSLTHEGKVVASITGISRNHSYMEIWLRDIFADLAKINSDRIWKPEMFIQREVIKEFPPGF